MASKKINSAAEIIAETQEVAPAVTQVQRNLFIKVTSFDISNVQCGDRIVDLYHYGTRSWLQNHHWWAMHNNVTVEVSPATDEEVNLYLEESKRRLADRYSDTGTVHASVAA